MRQISLLAITVLTAHIITAQVQVPYKIKSCKIVFAVCNRSQTGTRTLIFQDSGKIEKQEEVIQNDTSANIAKQARHTLRIQTADSIFEIDMNSLKGTRRSRFSDRPFGTLNYKKGSPDTFLGKKCIITNFFGIKTWYWKGIVLKEEFSGPLNDLNGQTSDYATAIDENYVISKDEFKVPAGVKIKAL